MLGRGEAPTPALIKLTVIAGFASSPQPTPLKTKLTD